MIEPANARARLKAHDILVRRSTTAAIGAAICLTGLATGAASGAQSAHSGSPADAAQGDSASAALAKAVADYEAAVAAQSQAAIPTQGQLQRPPRVAAAPRRAPAPVAVTGGS